MTQQIAKAGVALLRTIRRDLSHNVNRFDMLYSPRQMIEIEQALTLLEPVAAGTHVIVPVEPTEEMKRAYYEASAKAAREDFNADPGPWDDLEDDQRARLAQFGRAMLLAASQPKPEGREG